MVKGGLPVTGIGLNYNKLFSAAVEIVAIPKACIVVKPVGNDTGFVNPRCDRCPPVAPLLVDVVGFRRRRIA
jgi:hypothetical protein